MQPNAFTSICQQAETAIGERRILDALALTASIVADYRSSKDNDDISHLRSDYEAMLHFIAKGGTDDNFDASFDTTMQKVIELQQRAALKWQIKKKLTPFARILAQFTERDPLSIKDIDEQMTRLARSREGFKPFYMTLDACFGMLWTLPLPERVGADLAERIGRLNTFARLTLTSAVTLGTLEVFSPERIRALLLLARQSLDVHTDDEDLRARTMMGLALVSRRWERYIKFFADIRRDMDDILFSKLPHEQLILLNDALTRASMTKNVAKKSDEYLPEITKVIERHIKRFGSDEDKGDKDSQIKVNVVKIDATSEKMARLFMRHGKRLAEIREGGYDHHFSTFQGMVAHMNVFFDHIAHYLYPFGVKVPFVRETLEAQGTPKLTLGTMEASNFCDTDCYSYVAMINYVEKRGGGLADFMAEQLSELEEANEMPERYRGLDAWNNYAQMLYRIFHASPCVGEMEDVFSLTASQLLRPLIHLFDGHFSSYDDVSTAVEAMLWLDEASEALVLINSVQPVVPATAALLRHKGAALMALEQWNEALQALSQSQLLDEDADTAHDIVRCYEALGQWNAAAGQLETMSHDFPDEDLTDEMAYCYMKLQRWEEASNLLLKIEFEGNGTKALQRAIGWCALKMGKYARAEQYYRQLAEARRSRWTDHLNLGHALWLLGRREEAFAEYCVFVKAFNNTKEDEREDFAHWQEAFMDDAPSLLAATSSEATIAALAEAIAMEA